MYMNTNKNTNTDLFEQYPDILTVHQVRQALGIGRTAVYRLLDSKQIRCFKIGNAYKIPKVSLIEFIQSNGALPEGGDAK